MGIVEKIKNIFIKKDIKDTEKKSIFSQRVNLSQDDMKINDNVFYKLYQKNPDIRQAINKIALSVSKNGIVIKNPKGDIIEIEEVKNDITNYFEDQTFLKFKKELYKQYLLSGELYIINSENIKGETVGFEILDSRSITKKVDTEGNITSFVQQEKHGTQRTFNREEIAFYKLENHVNNQNNGMGLIEGIVRDGLSDYEGGKRNYYLIGNGAMPGGIVMLDEDLGEEEQKNAIDQLSRQHSGAENNNKLMIAGGVKDIKTLHISNKDMDRINQRKLTTEKVSSALGVPKTILGYTDGVNYANSKEQREEFLEGTVYPYQKDFEFIMNSLMAKFVPKVFNKYTLSADGETIDEKDRTEEAQRKDIELGIVTIDEVRQKRGLEEYNTEQSQNPVIKNNIIMLEDMVLNNGVNLSEE